MPGILDFLKPGVVTGDNLIKLLRYAQEHEFAIPAVNCTSSSNINAVLEAAKEAKAPIMIQFSNGGGAFYAGKSITSDGQKAAILGSISGALHVRTMAEHYGVPVVLHTDHCAKKLLPWLDGVIEADEKYFRDHGEPLFSSHMIDLSEEPHKENVEITAKYLQRLKAVNGFLEMEIGITGGEEDGVNNEGIDNSKLYTQPEDIDLVYRTLNPISPAFSVAAAFGNVHGVYAAGNVKLSPEILGNAQTYVAQKHNLKEKKPVLFVFHGGSGSEKAKIHEAIRHGVVKMNVDTDLQWAYWNGIREFYAKKKDYLQGQLGNPEGEDKPNKKFYDPRVWLREAEKTMITRVKEALTDLNCVNRL
eukprot:tig00020965_g16835.t1